jgi:hypothetical protein
MATRIKAVASIIEWDAELGRMAILNPGDEGEVGDVLAAAKLASGEAGPINDAEELAAEEITELRAQYQEALGKKAFPGWSAETLLAKIAEATDDQGPPA